MAEIRNAGAQVMKVATLALWVAVLASVAGCTPPPKPKWKVGQVSLVGSPPVACKTAVVGSNLVIIGANQVAQPVPYADKQPSPEFNLFDNASYCAVADVNVTIAAADATQWHAGDEAHLFVAHQHFPSVAGQVRYLAYNAAIPVTGQTTLTFKHVIVASASTLSLYENSTRGGLDVHLGQWPRQKAGVAKVTCS